LKFLLNGLKTHIMTCALQTTEMVVNPKIRGFICITAHPEGCRQHVEEQIAYVKSQPALPVRPKNVLVIGASTGYGLASRIVTAFSGGANTLGVFFERPAGGGRTASAGWYNTLAFENAAREAGYYAKSLNGDAFSQKMKDAVIKQIQADLGNVDCIIYSLASPRRTDPVTGEVYASVLKPIGQSFSDKTVDTDKKTIQSISIEPANEAEIAATEKVMGGEDWALWIDALQSAGVLAPGAMTVAYSYIGPEVTWPIYTNGTIGNAKAHLEATAHTLNEKLKSIGGKAVVAVNKAVVTQASSAIPVVPLYVSILLKVMKEKGLNEGCIEQMYRLFKTQLASGADFTTDSKGRIRVDDWEMREDVQSAVKAIWPTIQTENLMELSDFESYQKEFLKLFGFGNVDASLPVNVELPIPGLIEVV
jgi:enoyl-[acyl-carrier protein] reductase/trans-2-enoyl-CoA reductase (NAD+)